MGWGHISSEHSWWCPSAAVLSGEGLSIALAYQEGTLLKRRGTELRIQVMKGTYPCEISSAVSRGENCPHKAEDSTEEKDNSQHTHKEYWCRLFYGLTAFLATGQNKVLSVLKSPTCWSQLTQFCKWQEVTPILLTIWNPSAHTWTGTLLWHPSFTTACPAATEAFHTPFQFLISPEVVSEGTRSFWAYSTLSRCSATTICVI